MAPLASGSTARTIQRLAAAGGTSSAISVPMTPGSYASIVNSSSTPIAIRFGTSAPTAVTTDLELGSNGRFDWYVEEDTMYVAAIAADGSTAYECWVFGSSVK